MPDRFVRVSGFAIIVCMMIRASEGRDRAGEVESREQRVFVVDSKYDRACGPISAYVALKAIGISTPLDSIAARCRWEPGKLTTLSAIRDALNSVDGVNCVARRLTPQELIQALADPSCVAILPVRKSGEKINHVVCAVRANSKQVLLIDYPELRVSMPLEQLTDVWDGQVLVVNRGEGMSVMKMAVWLTLPVLATLMLAGTGAKYLAKAGRSQSSLKGVR